MTGVAWNGIRLGVQHYEFVGDGEERQLQPGRDASLVEDVREVAFHGLFADGELFGDVLVAAAFDDAGDDLELARGQAVGLALGDGCSLLHELTEGTQEVYYALAADPVVTGEDGSQGVGEIAGDRVFQDDAARADLQRFDDLLRGDSGGEQNDLDARRTAHDGAHRLQARQARHLQIEQQDI